MSNEVNKVRSEIKAKGFSDEEDEKLVRRPTNLNKNEKDFEKILDESKGQKKEDGTLAQPISFVSGEPSTTLKKEAKVAGEEVIISSHTDEKTITLPSTMSFMGEVSNKVGKETRTYSSSTPIPEEIHSKNSLLAPDKAESIIPQKQQFSTLIKDMGKLVKHEEIHDEIAMAQHVPTIVESKIMPQNIIAAPVESQANRIERILNLISEHISLLETKHETNTTITIDNIPKFEGVKLTVSTYKTAKGEVNITFENLTQEAKNILDRTENRAALQVGLDQKGYTVHIITTTTTVDKTYADATIPYKENRNEFYDQQQSAKDQQQQENQDERES